MIDWLRHFRVRRVNGIYPHPGMWLTRGDWSDYRIVQLVQAFDATVIAPVMCRLGHHRWITIWPPGRGTSTRCWYCRRIK